MCLGTISRTKILKVIVSRQSDEKRVSKLMSLPSCGLGSNPKFTLVFQFKKDACKWVKVLVLWSACPPSTPTIRVQILLKYIVFVLEKNENKLQETYTCPLAIIYSNNYSSNLPKVRTSFCTLK